MRLTSNLFAGGSVHPVVAAGGHVHQLTGSTVHPQRVAQFLLINSSCSTVFNFYKIYENMQWNISIFSTSTYVYIATVMIQCESKFPICATPLPTDAISITIFKDSTSYQILEGRRNQTMRSLHRQTDKRVLKTFSYEALEIKTMILLFP